MEPPPDDEGPVLVNAANQNATRGPRGQRRATRATDRWLTAPPLHLPQMPDYIEWGLPQELFGELVLYGPVHGPAGQAARPLARKRTRGGVTCLGRSRDELMQTLEMVPDRQPALWNAIDTQHPDGTQSNYLFQV